MTEEEIYNAIENIETARKTATTAADGATTATDAICNSCKAFDTFANLSTQYADGLSKLLQPGILIIFTASVVLWITWRGLEIIMGSKPLQSLFTDFLWITLAAGLIIQSNNSGLIKSVYDMGLSTMSGAASIAISVGADSTPKPKNFNNMNALLDATDKAFKEIFSKANVFWGEGRNFNRGY